MVFREHRHSVVTIRNSFFILTVLIIEETQLERTLSRFDLFYLCIDDGVRYRYGWGLGRVPVSLEASISRTNCYLHVNGFLFILKVGPSCITDHLVGNFKVYTSAVYSDHLPNL